MNRVHAIAFRLLLASLVLCSCFAATNARANANAFAVTRRRQSHRTKQEAEANPFAPEPAGPLPAGMTGSDTNDPRAKLTPGIYDAGEAAMGIKHVLLVKKPDAFQLGSNNPDDPKVQKTLGQLGVVAKREDTKAECSWLLLSSLLQTRTLRFKAITCSRETFMVSTSTTSPIRRRPVC